ncbi:MAG TPA: class IV adenylate cyclase [Terriglobales bacterium]|jgi:adenylate cyclase class 2|nr:class IV adenylate cyclase [Terriglobales bacterium]
MGSSKEIEIKFRIGNARDLNRRLQKSGFRLITPRTHEINTLYDLTNKSLRQRGELLRLRKYGSEWVLTHKAKGKVGRHKTRVETETKLENGAKMDAILRALGFAPTFRYEKFRAEWSDGKGHVVVDQTPIGEFGEIEGPSRWIDRTAKLLQILPNDYITATYTELFFQWKNRTQSPANEMTFKAIRSKTRLEQKK